MLELQSFHSGIRSTRTNAMTMREALWIVSLAALLSFSHASETITYRIPEEQPIGRFVGDIARDAGLVTRYDPSQLNRMRYSFLSDAGQTVTQFHIDERSGQLTTAVEIDRESECRRLSADNECQITFGVAVSVDEHSEVITVIATITDENDNIPAFSDVRSTIVVPESQPVGSMLNLPVAADPDAPPNGLSRYELRDPSNVFELHVRDLLGGPQSVQLRLLEMLDRETVPIHSLVLLAVDGGSPPQTGSTVIDVRVTDSNDHAPRFEEDTSMYTFTVSENTPVGSSVATIRAFDQDEGENGRVRYHIAPPSHSLPSDQDPRTMFNIDSVSGVLTVKAEVDYEEEQSYTMAVGATDAGANPNTAYATVNIIVQDVNDNPPVMSIDTLTDSGVARVEENVDPGAFVSYVSVRDLDYDGEQAFTCDVSNSLNFALNSVSPNRYTIVTRNFLDRERQAYYNITVNCHDNGATNVLRNSKTVLLEVVDVNDHAPIFTYGTYNAEISENNEIGESVIQVTAVDEDDGINADVTYQLSAEVAEFFTLNAQTGLIRASTVFDYERLPSVSFIVYAVDRGVPVQTSTAVVTLDIRDTNDEAPMFLQQSYTFRVREEQPGGTEVGPVSAQDADSDQFSVIQYSLLSVNGESIMFTMDASDGVIRTSRVLRREDRPVYYLTVAASNTGDASLVLSSTASVTVSILDINNNAPIITYPSSRNHTIVVSSHVPLGEKVTTVEAYDLDEGINAKLSFSLRARGNTGAAFAVDASSGDIKPLVSLDHIEGQEQFEYDVKVTDGVHETSQYLVITVDSSIPFLGAAASSKNSLLSGGNLTIVVAMTASCGFIVILLIIAIIVIRTKDRRRRQRKENARRALDHNGQLYNCQIEPHVGGMQNGAMIHQEESFPGDNKLRYDSSSSTGQSHKKSVSFRSDRKQLIKANNTNGNSWPTRDRQKKNDAEWELSAKKARTGDREEGGGGGDSDSAYSGDISNTDSGRGPSEEGEQQANHHQQKGSNSFFDMQIPTPAKPGGPRQGYPPYLNPAYKSAAPPPPHPPPQHHQQPAINTVSQHVASNPNISHVTSHPTNHSAPPPHVTSHPANRNADFQNNKPYSPLPRDSLYYDNTLLPPVHRNRNNATPTPASSSAPNTSRGGNDGNQRQQGERSRPSPAHRQRSRSRSPSLVNRNSTGSNGSSTSGSYVVDHDVIHLEGVDGTRGFKSIVV